MQSEGDSQEKSIEKRLKKIIIPPKQIKLKKSQSLIKKFRFRPKSRAVSQGDVSTSTQPSTSSEPPSAERHTPEGGENFKIVKSVSDTNLRENRNLTDKRTEKEEVKENLYSKESTADSEHNPYYSTETVTVPERTKSLEHIPDMPAYGDLIVGPSNEPSNIKEVPRKKDLLYKILVIGDLGTGKTSIIKRYVHQFFSQHYRATIGVDFALKVINWDEVTTIRLQLWDIAGQERYGNMTRVYYKDAVGAFIVFDVTRVNSFESVANWKADLDNKVQLPNGAPIPCILLANKCDQPKEGPVTNVHKMEEYCKEKNFAAWFETSAKDNINIDDAAKALIQKILQNDSILNDANKDDEHISLHKDHSNHKKMCSC